MSHPPTPPASCNDCGACETCQESDDYGPAWRNPEFRSPHDAPPSTDSARPATETRRQPEYVHGPALTRDGFTEALLRRDGGR